MTSAPEMSVRRPITSNFGFGVGAAGGGGEWDRRDLTVNTVQYPRVFEHLKI